MSNNSNILIYQNSKGGVQLDVRLEDETVWLTQTQMSELFGNAVPTINEHTKNIYAGQELSTEATLRKIGNSEFSTKPTQRLKEYIIKGFVLNEKDNPEWRNLYDAIV